MHCVNRGGSYLVNSYSDLQEDHQWKTESYNACWMDLVLGTRPQYRWGTPVVVHLDELVKHWTLSSTCP